MTDTDEPTDDGSTEEQARPNFLVDADMYERAKENADHGELSERFRGVVRDLAGDREGDPELRRLRDDLDDAIEERDDCQRALDAAEAEVDRLRSKIAEREEYVEECEAEYSDALDALTERLADGDRVNTYTAEDAAECHPEKMPEDVIATLKERFPNVPDHAFGDWTPHGPDWDGAVNGERPRLTFDENRDMIVMYPDLAAAVLAEYDGEPYDSGTW